jgi:hypothetical protein
MSMQLNLENLEWLCLAGYGHPRQPAGSSHFYCYPAKMLGFASGLPQRNCLPPGLDQRRLLKKIGYGQYLLSLLK